MNSPSLIEPNAKYFLFSSLKTCHETRVNIYYYALNVSVFLIFVGIIGFLLYYCHKHKLSDYEKDRKMIRDQQYIMSKIRFCQEESKERNESSITALPFV